MTLSRFRPTTITDGTRLLAAEMELLQDEYIKALDGVGGGSYALATDVTLTNQGTLAGWSEIVPALNWQAGITVTNCGYSPLWIPYDNGGYWFTFGTSSGVPLVSYGYQNGNWTSGLISLSDGLFPAACGGSATNGTTSIVGGTPGSASANKIRSYVNTDDPGSATWLTRATVASGTEGVACAVWFSGATKYIVGLTNTASTNIETSSTGTTWTQVTGLPNTDPRGSLATNGTIVVCMASTSVNRCITSTNATTWTQRTLPQTDTWSRVVYDSVNGLFIAIGSTYWAYSADGITWTQGTLGILPFPTCAISGRVMAALNVTSIYAQYIDGTYKMRQGQVGLYSFTASRAMAVGGNQFLATGTSGLHVRSIAAGSLTT